MQKTQIGNIMSQWKSYQSLTMAILFLGCLISSSLIANDIITLQQMARAGDKAAQYQLAIEYDLSQGVKQNHEKAVEWYQRAAEQGHREAQYNLAVSYYEGQGISKDKNKAFHWYIQAAKSGHAEAQNNLGMMYEQGIGPANDTDSALYWYHQSAKNKSVLGQYNLAKFYSKSDQDRDLVQAYAWFATSENNGEKNALYNKLTVLNQLLTNEYRQQAQDLANEYVSKYVNDTYKYIN